MTCSGKFQLSLVDCSRSTFKLFGHYSICTDAAHQIAETSSAFLEDMALGKWHSTCSSLSKHNNQTIICKMRGHLSHHSPVLPFARASSGQGCRSDRTLSPRMAPGTICISISCTAAASTRIAAAA